MVFAADVSYTPNPIPSNIITNGTDSSTITDGTTSTAADANTITNTTPLPPGDSPSLILAPATPTERITVLKLNSAVWKGPLEVSAYIAREDHLKQQQLTGDRLTCWILVDRAQEPDHRTIFASCESFKKGAVVAYGGKVEETATHGVGSVYCRPEFRGMGYAKRMMEELAIELETWQIDKVKDGREKALFTVLWSDIGKEFYKQFGWEPFDSAHVELVPIDEREFKRELPGVDLPWTRDLTAEEINGAMCSEEVMKKEREFLRAASLKSPGAKVAVNPDFEHFTWHWAREEFYAERLCPEKAAPVIKGVGHDGAGVYCAWNRNFGETPEENTLFILRWVYDEPTTPAQTEATIEAMAAILRRAQREAHEWGMAKVEFWNPAPLMQKAVSLLDPTAEIIHREKSSIASLRWIGGEQGLGDDVEWFWNEKYAWC
ncbi:hypothetical protein SI65_04570 [Aspergillus cristatus]|uniref:N-acetyltransferase domain-containing protein n=1 Tax=Aspergillus cristatus TaxID=573508 RepID=A0A1E3BF31_ASPCR|nr:hypothetical protein SI65_04570 [Aspergillus cristatus]